LLEEIRVRAERNERVLVTTLTKRMAEDLSEYFTEIGVRCGMSIPKSKLSTASKFFGTFGRGEFDVLIGINLLREGPGIFPKSHWWRSWTRIRKAICVAHVAHPTMVAATAHTDVPFSSASRIATSGDFGKIQPFTQ